MDSSHAHPSDQTASPKPAQPAPAMDIVAPPKMAEPPKQTEDAPAPAEHTAKMPVHQTAPKPHGNGLGVLIFATVVIVLGLGALMVYAYLRSNAISIF